MSKVCRRLFVTIFGALICVAASAQSESANNSYSPYSLFGIGDIYSQGTALNNGMGGVGIAMRNRQFINYLNPAAVTARDTLAFMADINLSSQNKMFSQGGKKSANNTFNISGVSFTVPIYERSAFIAGITPFSDVAFDFSSLVNKELLAQTGYITRTASGQGGIYQLFAGAGMDINKNLSVGAQLLYYFGKLDKDYTYTFESSSTNSLYTGYDLNLHAITGKLGVQYEKRLPNGLTVSAGVTHRLRTSLKGTVKDYKYASLSSVADTLRYAIDTLGKGKSGLHLAGETGIGFSVRNGSRWNAEVDFVYSDWSGSNLDAIKGFANGNDAAVFTTTKAMSFRAGFEYTPNKNDIRYYFRRCTYRAGFYYDKAYYKVNGNAVNTMGVTLGMTLPIFRWYNGLTVAVNAGQRGKTANGLIKERFVSFTIGFNIHDVWFQKPRYE